MDASNSMDAVQQATETAARALGRMRERVNGSEQPLRTFVQEYPFTAFFAAVAAGYVVARLFTSRR